MADYIIPLGVDGKEVLSGVDAMIKGMDMLEDKGRETGKSIQTGFEAGAKASGEMEKNLKPIGKGIDEVLNKAKAMKKDFRESLDIRKEGAEFSKQIDSFKTKLAEVTTQNKVGIEVDPASVNQLKEATQFLAENFTGVTETLSNASAILTGNIEDTKEEISIIKADIELIEESLKGMAPGAAMAESMRELGSAKNALAEEEAALADYENQLKQTDSAQKDLTKTLSDARKAVELLTVEEIGLNSAFEDVYGDLKPLTTRLGELEDRMYEMALAGKQNTQEFRELQEEAIRYRQTIQQVDAAVDTFAKNSAVLDIAVEAAQGLTGAFAAVQGAAALLGGESEQVQEALLKVTAAMSVMQGVQQVASLLNRNSAISALLLRNATVAKTAATVADTAATEGQTVATRTMTVATRAASVALKGLGIGLIIGLISYLVTNWDKLTAAVNKFLPAGESVGKLFDTITSYAVGVGNAIFQYLITPFTAVTALISGDLEGFKNAIVDGYSFKKNFTDAFNDQELENEKAHQRELEAARIEADARDLERRRNRGEDVSKLEEDLQRRRVANLEANSKAYEEEQRKLEDLEDAALKRRNDEIIKAGEEAKKLSEEAAKEATERRKKELAQVEEYTNAVRDMRIAGIKDAGERERAEIDATFQARLDALEKEPALTEEARKLQIDLEIEAVEERNRRIEDLERNLAKEQLEIRMAAQEMLAGLGEESRDNELKLLEIDHERRKEAITEQFKNEEGLRTELLAALTESTERERRRILAEWGERNLREEEERQILAIELAGEYAKRSERTERQKQIAILETKVEFAQRYIDSLLASGADESSLEVLQARKALKDLRDGLEDEIKANQNRGFNLFEFLGLDLEDDQKQAIEKAGSIIGSNLKQVTDLIIQQYDRQIEKQQEAIDQTNDEINDLEDRLEDEKKLREDGFANNVAIIEAEIVEKKRQRDEEIKQQEEMIAKREQMQRAEMALDTAVQLVNLTTASTEIFKALAGIPFVGIPLAIATVATMFGAFTAAKIKAAEAIGQTKKYGHGGWIDGKPHSQGGKKYYSDSGDVTELEKNEFVVRRKQALKYSNLLEAINKGNFTGFDVNDHGLREMLSGMGISMLEDSSRKGLEEAKRVEANKYLVTVNMPSNDAELKDIAANMRFLAQRERERRESWEDDKYVYLKEGNKTTRIKKKTENEPGK